MLQTKELTSPEGAVVTDERAEPAACRIAALGFDPRLRNAMELLFKSRLNGRFVFANADEADLHLIDLDSYGGQERWVKQTEARPNHPIILLAMREVEVTGKTRFVRKPLSPQDLIAALTAAADDIGVASAGVPSDLKAATDAARHQGNSRTEPQADPTPLIRPAPVQAMLRKPREQDEGAALASSRSSVGQSLGEHDAKTFIGLASDIDPKDPKQVAKTQFEPGAYLIGKLQQALTLAIRHDRVVRLDLEHGSITLLPRTRQAVIDLQHIHLRTLAVVPLSEENSKLRFGDSFELSEAPQHRIWQLDSLLWNAALLASRGRVPVGTDLMARVKLKRWPNLTRLAVFPGAVRITAFLSREPVSLVDAARILKIPQRCVFAFFTAADALGLMEQATGKSSEGNLPDAPEKPAKRGLLRRILSHLRS